MKIEEMREGIQVLQRDLMHHRADISRSRPDFETRIGRYLSPSRPFDVQYFQSDAAFIMDQSGAVTFNASAIEAFHQPINDAEAGNRIGKEAAESARQMAIEQLVVHELAHVGIGLTHFEDVQFFKSVVGTDALGEIDVAADGAAAHICALLEVFRADDTRPLAIAHRFLEQLVLMGTFAFPAFKSPADKPHKRRRFLGLAMMAARAQYCIETGDVPDLLRGDLPLEASIYPYCKDDGEVLICAFNPDRVLWGRTARVDVALLATTLDELDSADFAVSVQRATRLLSEMGTLAIAPVSETRPAVTGKGARRSGLATT